LRISPAALLVGKVRRFIVASVIEFPVASILLSGLSRIGNVYESDNEVVDDFNADPLRDMLDFFILKRLSDDGPLLLLEIQQRAKTILGLLDLFATRAGNQGPGSLAIALQRLQREGWLKTQPPFDSRPGSESLYSLSEFGKQRLEEEEARHASMLSRFIEDGEPEKSFRKFLDSSGSSKHIS
jgi:DNA-binding PadR family transcriptional regulator